MGELSSEQRSRLPRDAFAIPEKAPGSGSYPLQDRPGHWDEAHAKDALARVEQHGTPEEKARVISKVKAHFPDMDVEAKA